MKLTDIKKNAEAKAAEARARQEAAQRLRELDVHPLLKWKCDRNVRDAYFSGIVFAALANDLKIDDAERKVIDRIGASLQLVDAERDEMMDLVCKTVETAVKTGDANPFALLEDCARSLKDENLIQLFAAEYLKVSGAKSLDEEDVCEQLTEHVFAQTGVALDSRFFTALCRCEVSNDAINDNDLVAVADVLGDNVLRYLMLDTLGDVTDRLAGARKSLVARAKPKKGGDKGGVPTKEGRSRQGGETPLKSCANLDLLYSRVIRKHGRKVRVTVSAMRDISKAADGIIPDKVNWPREVNNILGEVEE